MITELVLGTIALALLKSHKTISGIGRVKRRIYIEIEAAQNAGVRLDQKFIDLTSDEKSALSDIAQSFGWKQTTRSIESGKSYAEAYFGSLKRAYNTITGIYGIGATEHRVKNADGQVILRWSAPEEVLEHIKQEEDLAEVEKRLAKRRASIRKQRKQSFIAPQPNLQEDEPANENTPVLTKQQEILQMFPYLKTAVDVKEGSYGMVTYNTDSRDNFNYVVWRQMFSPDFSGEEKVVAEGPIMAAYTESDAQLVKKLFAKHTDNYKTGNYRDGYTKHNKESRYTIKPIHKVNLDKIAGIGYADYYDYFG